MVFPLIVHYLCGGFNVEVTQTPIPMATATYTPTHCPDTGRKFTKAERKAANKAKFKAELASKVKPKRPSLREAIEMVNGTAERHHTYGTEATAAAFEQAKANLREIEAAKSKPKRKPAKASTPKPKRTKAGLMRLTKAELVALLMEAPTSAPKRKPKRKKAAAAPKARKATPQERTADRQDRTHHGRPAVGPITPQPAAPQADVDHARNVARTTGAANRKRKAFDLATRWAFDGTYGGTYLPTQQAELTRLLGSTDVSTYEDIVAITH